MGGCVQRIAAAVFLLFCSVQRGSAQSNVLPLVVERIETEVKPALAASYLNCTVGFLDSTNQVLWIRVFDGLQISQNDIIVTTNKEDSYGNPKYEVQKRQGRSAAVPDGYGTNLWTYMLIIRQLQQNDAGTYRCQIVVQGVQSYPYRDGTLIVQVPPQVLYAVSTTVIQANIGESASLSCYADGIPTPNITWQRGNGIPFQNGLERIRGNMVNLTNIQASDRGIYRCFAQNNVGNAAEYDATVTVNYAPIAQTARPGGQYGQAPDRQYEIILECLISGQPDPDLYWYKGSSTTPLNDNTKYEIEKLIHHGANDLLVDQRIFIIRILFVQSGDYDTYTCVGQNSLGSANATVQLFPLSTCQGPICPLEGSISIGSPQSTIGYSLPIGLLLALLLRSR